MQTGNGVINIQNNNEDYEEDYEDDDLIND
jgi:hypothetical protein